MTLVLSRPPTLLSSSDQSLERDAHYERLFWLATMADGDSTALARHVLDRVRPEAELVEGDPYLLDMESGDRRRVEIYFSTLASRRLARKSLDQRRYARTIGHPVDAPREAFEANGEYEIAAAFAALVHDKLAGSASTELLAQQCRVLRFSVARLLAIVSPEVMQICRRLATKTLEELARDHPDGALGDLIRTWLATTSRPVSIDIPIDEPAAPHRRRTTARTPGRDEPRHEDVRFEDPPFGALPAAAQSFL